MPIVVLMTLTGVLLERLSYRIVKNQQTLTRTECLDGKTEAKVFALRLGQPPKGFANWSLRLLAEQVVELGLVESISHETFRHDKAEDSILSVSSQSGC